VDQKVSIVLEVEDNGSLVIKKFGDVVDDTSKKITGMGRALEMIKWDAITNLISKAGMALRKAFDMAELGAHAMQVESAFRQMAAGAGMSANKLLSDLKTATQGMVTTSDLMASANRMIASGMSADQIVKMSAAVTELAKRGYDTKDAIQALAVTMETGTTRGLREFGIGMRNVTIEANNLALQMTGKTFDALSIHQRQQVLSIALLKEVARATHGATDAQVDAYVKLQQGKAAWEEFKEAVGKAVVAVGYITASAFYGLIVGVETVYSKILEFAAGATALIGKGAALMSNIPGMQGIGASILGWAANEEKEIAAAYEKVGQAIITNTAKMQALNETGRQALRSALGEPMPDLPKQADTRAKDDENRKQSMKDQNEIIKAGWKDIVATINEQEVEAMNTEKEARDKNLDSLKIDLANQQNAIKINQTQIEAVYARGYLTDAEYIKARHEAESAGIQAEIADIAKERSIVESSTKAQLDIAYRYYWDRISAIETTFAQEEALYKGNKEKITALESLKDADIQNATKKLEQDKDKIISDGEKKTTDLTIKENQKRTDATASSIKEQTELYKNMEKDIAPAMSEVGNSFMSAIGSITDGSKKARDSFRDMAMSIIKYLEQMIMRMILFGNLEGKYNSSSTGAGGILGFFGSLLHGITGGGESLYPSTMTGADIGIGFMREGGITPSMLAHYPLRSYAEGGIASSPQIGIFGEGGGEGEAFVPLRGGKIPVEGGGGGQQHFHYYHIEAMDSKSFEETLSRNPSAVMRVLNKDKRLDGTTAKGTR
jgi:hypothetical protein